jgi:hypothetical protein
MIKNIDSNNLNDLVEDLANKFALETYEVKDAINISLSKVYGLRKIVVTANGSILGIKNTTNEFDIKHYNISNKNFKIFTDYLDVELYNRSTNKIKKSIYKIIKTNKNILYSKVVEINNNVYKLKILNKNGKEIKNFFVFIKKENFFKNENPKIDDGFLIYIPKREKLHVENGFFYIKAVRKHESVIRYIINNRFKNIKKHFGSIYGYNKCIINIESKKIVLKLRIFFSDVIKEYFEESLKEFDDFKVIYINDFKGSINDK